jgi:azurin
MDGSSYTSSGDYLMADKAIVIDLTACFGSGKEPSLSEMDALLSQFSDYWFDGSADVMFHY